MQPLKCECTRQQSVGSRVCELNSQKKNQVGKRTVGSRVQKGKEKNTHTHTHTQTSKQTKQDWGNVRSDQEYKKARRRTHTHTHTRKQANKQNKIGLAKSSAQPSIGSHADPHPHHFPPTRALPHCVLKQTQPWQPRKQPPQMCWQSHRSGYPQWTETPAWVLGQASQGARQQTRTTR